MLSLFCFLNICDVCACLRANHFDVVGLGVKVAPLRPHVEWQATLRSLDGTQTLVVSRLSKPESYGEFEAVFLKEPNKHAPLKKKFISHNNNPFMTKDLRKQIMVQSKLRNIFNKNRNYENWCKYKRQRNLPKSFTKNKKEFL